MKNQSIVILAFLFSISATHSKHAFIQIPRKNLRKQKNIFRKNSIALLILYSRNCSNPSRETDKINNVTTVQEINYYTIVCALKAK